MKTDFRDLHLIPTMRGFLSGTIDAAKEKGCEDRYTFALSDITSVAVDVTGAPPVFAHAAVFKELSLGVSLRGWRFGLSPYSSGGQRLVSAMRLNS